MMLRIWKATERQRLVPVEMETAFPFLLEPNHVVSLLGGGGKTTLLYEMAGFGVRNGQKVLVTTSDASLLPTGRMAGSHPKRGGKKISGRLCGDYRK